MSHRSSMVAAEIRKIVALLAREIPPDVSGFASVTEVEMPADLSIATVYVSALDRAPAAVEYLIEQKPELKRRLSQSISGYKLPELRFVVDDRAERGSRVDELLEKIAKPKTKRKK